MNFLADSKSLVQTHTLCATQVDKNRQNRTHFCSSFSLLL